MAATLRMRRIFHTLDELLSKLHWTHVKECQITGTNADGAIGVHVTFNDGEELRAKRDEDGDWSWLDQSSVSIA